MHVVYSKHRSLQIRPGTERSKDYMPPTIAPPRVAPPLMPMAGVAVAPRALTAAAESDAASVVVSEKQHGDGKIERVFADGKRLLVFSNGTRKFV